MTLFLSLPASSLIRFGFFVCGLLVNACRCIRSSLVFVVCLCSLSLSHFCDMVRQPNSSPLRPDCSAMA